METNHTEKEGGDTERSQAVASIFARIEREGIIPTPRWHFLAREGVVWVLGAASVGVGALAVAGTLFEFQNTWWGAYEATHESFADFFLDALPYVWLVAFALFAYSAYWSLRATKRGYRYSLLFVICGSLVVTGAVGVALSVFGAGRFVDENMGAYIPFHHSLLVREHSRWMLPSEGRIAGIVREVPFAENVLWVESIDGEPYQILIDLAPPDRTRLRPGEQVRIAGIPTTTAGILEGCVLFIQRNDVLHGAYHTAPAGRDGDSDVDDVSPHSERKVFFARNDACKDLRSYVRMAPQAH